MIFPENVMPFIRKQGHEIDRIPKMMNNQVLVKLIDDFFSPVVKLKSGLYQDISWETTENAMFRGEVVAVPDKLRFYPDRGFDNMEHDGIVSISDYDTTMELQVGDIIYYGYHHFKRVAQKNKLLLYNEKCECFFPVKYDKIYCAIRNDQFIPVNGYNLVEDIKTNTSLIINNIEVFTNNKISHIAVGEVKAVGTPLNAYMYKFEKEYFYKDTGFAKPGDIIFYHTGGTITAKYFDGPGSKFKATHERFILAKWTKKKVIVNKHVLYVKPIKKPVSRIIHRVDIKDVSAFAEAEVLDAPKHLKHLIGKKILHDKSNLLTFEKDLKRYDFVMNINTYTTFISETAETIAVHD